MSSITTPIPTTQATDVEVAAAVAAAKNELRFGDGRDGAIAWSVANNRWENGSGAALATEARWNVAGVVLTLLKTCYFTNVTDHSSTTIKCGADNTHAFVQFCFNGTYTGAGVVTAGYAADMAAGVAALAPLGGAEKTTAGAGNVGTSFSAQARHGHPGASGAGGGDGTNAGGNGHALAGNNTTHALIHLPYLTLNPSAVTGSGTTVAGVSGGNANSAFANHVSNFESPWMWWNSPCGSGGGGGALKQTGGSNKGGAGGDAGRGKLPLIIRGNILVLAATCVIHNDGLNGSNGSPGVATNAAGDISGGGGGGSGGCGGAINCLYGTLTDAGATWRSNAGTSGTGGLGFQFNASARATSNGGDAGTSTGGIIVKQQAS
jgi:hypothetical protein